MRIGVLDSGIGGLNVLAELVREAPDAEFVYIGDSANVPYGGRSIEQIRSLSRESAAQLRARDIDLAVIACNSVTIHALDLIQKDFGETPVVGMIEPAIEHVVQSYKRSGASGPILVLGTAATTKSGVYGKRFKSLFSGTNVQELACPQFVPLIENGRILGKELEEAVESALARIPLLPQGMILLACTHYGWIREAIERALPGWVVVDPSRAAALAASALAWQIQAQPKAQTGAPIEWIFTAPEKVPAFARAAMRAMENRLNSDVRTQAASKLRPHL